MEAIVRSVPATTKYGVRGLRHGQRCFRTMRRMDGRAVTHLTAAMRLLYVAARCDDTARHLFEARAIQHAAFAKRRHV